MTIIEYQERLQGVLGIFTTQVLEAKKDLEEAMEALQKDAEAAEDLDPTQVLVLTQMHTTLLAQQLEEAFK